MKNSSRSDEKELFWRMVLQEQGDSGLSIKAFCQQQELSLASFYAWRRKIRRCDAPASPTADPPTPLVPVTVVDSGSNRHSSQSSATVVEIITPCGFTLRVDQVACPAEITGLLRAILCCQSEAASC